MSAGNRVDSGSQEMSLAQRVGAIVGTKYITDDRRALRDVGVTLASGDGDAIVVHPGSAAEISELMHLANREGLVIIPVGSGARSLRRTGLERRRRLFIDCQRMNHVIDLDETSLIAHVQAGLSGLAMEEILAPRGLSLGDYPHSTLASTIGGLLSVRTPGKSSPRHGFIEDAVVAISAVLADGRSVHTRVAPRRATGPDLARALCGSEGALGIITSATLRIHRLPERRLLAAYQLLDVPAAVGAVHLALREEAAPSALRIYDPDEARVHLAAKSDHFEPKKAILVVATAGPTDLAVCDRDLFTSAVQAVDGETIDSAVAELWWGRRTGRTKDDDPPPLPNLQVSATPGKQIASYRAIKEAAQHAGVGARIHMSRFDATGAVLFVTLTEPDSDTPLSPQRVAVTRPGIEQASEAAGAVLLGATNATMASYFQNLRRELDPNGIMNPGAFDA